MGNVINSDGEAPADECGACSWRGWSIGRVRCWTEPCVRSIDFIAVDSCA